MERGSSSYQICGINLRNADLDYAFLQLTAEHPDRFCGRTLHCPQSGTDQLEIDTVHHRLRLRLLAILHCRSTSPVSDGRR